ncbi:MAG: permease [Desulfobulbaceae bacterium]|nr:permease [Desulfobulbaceae bacterium]
MEWKREWKALAWIVTGFLACYYLPVGVSRFDNAVMEALHLVKWYAEEHVLLCLVPAFFIAGAIAVFVSQASVLKYLGAKANKVLAYGVASVSGTILAVCSCTILPLFAGIYRMGAGLGPATAFLYSGPAINILAIILTARILGPELGIARAVGAIVFAVIIGLLMAFFFRKEELEKAEAQMALPEAEVTRPLWQNALYFAAMIGILVFVNWGGTDDTSGLWHTIYVNKWLITSLFSAAFGVMLMTWYGLPKWQVVLAATPAVVLALAFSSHPTLAFVAGFVGLSALISTRDDENGEWFRESWGFAKQILPLLLFGGKGPALALLLAGPALSLPNMLVIRSVMGTKKTLVFVSLVVVMATAAGMIYGTFY